MEALATLLELTYDPSLVSEPGDEFYEEVKRDMNRESVSILDSADEWLMNQELYSLESTACWSYGHRQSELFGIGMGCQVEWFVSIVRY
jgi:hypothetical protein